MYLSWNEQTITDFSENNINSLYSQGYIFTRRGKGVMRQTRSLRIDLSKFELSSENRRILKKTEGLQLTAYDLPLANYTWQIGKLGHDFYETKFGKGTFSANKIKELLIDVEKSNFNRLLVYAVNHPGDPWGRPPLLSKEGLESYAPSTPLLRKEGPLRPQSEGGVVDAVGYCIALETNELLHYAYPFYNLSIVNGQMSNVGLGMMLRAILYAKEQDKKYIYLGSAQRPADTYKLQFAGLEWFDGTKWSDDLHSIKEILYEI